MSCALLSNLVSQEQIREKYVQEQAPKDMEIYPNPAHGKVKIFFFSPIKGQGYITVMDNTGSPVSHRRVECMQGKNYWDQELPNQYNTNYWIEIRIDSIIRRRLVNTIRLKDNLPR